MDGSISFNGSEIAVVGALLTSLTTALAFIFRQLLAAKDAQITTLQAELKAEREESRQRDIEWKQLLVANVQASAKAADLATQRTTGSPM